MIKAHFLDLNGTLLDDEAAMTAAVRALFHARRSRLANVKFETFAQHWSRCSGQQREWVTESIG